MQDLEFRQLVERIKLRSPIESVVEERVSDLKKKGALYWARCPFHEERTPSFAVDPRRGTWRCFGACGEGGDAISFVQRFDGLSFVEALVLLGRACGEEVPEGALRKRGGARDERAEGLFDVLDRARRLYARCLAAPEGAEALRYVRERGFDDRTLEAFGIGWAPEHGNPLLDAALASGVDRSLLEECGLVKRADDGRAYDFFRGRLMIPIRDRLGRTVGFGGRVLPSRAEHAAAHVGKYVNTPETRLFKKGELIFGLDLATPAVRRKRHLILVEGYTDVMAAHQAGVEEVAAVLGTSTTEDHAALVRRSGAQRVTLFFDGDAAGRKASRRALAGLLPLGLDLDVVSPPEGSDPCDVFLGGGEPALRERLDGARDWFAWCVEELEGLSGAALARGVDELFGLLARLEKPVEQESRLVELARALGLAESAVRRQWAAHARSHGGERPRPGARPEPPAEGPQPADEAPRQDAATLAAFRSLIGALLLDNSLIPVYGELESRCPAGELRTIFRAVLHLYEHGEEGEPVHAGAVMTMLGDDPAREAVVGLEELAATAESPQILARDQELWLERRRHEEELAALRERLARALGDVAQEGGTQELLEDLHDKMRRARVVEGASPSQS